MTRGGVIPCFAVASHKSRPVDGNDFKRVVAVFADGTTRYKGWPQNHQAIFHETKGFMYITWTKVQGQCKNGFDRSV